MKETQRETSTLNKMDLERSATYETYGWFDEYITQNTFFSLCSVLMTLYSKQPNEISLTRESLTMFLFYFFSIWWNEGPFFIMSISNIELSSEKKMKHPRNKRLILTIKTTKNKTIRIKICWNNENRLRMNWKNKTSQKKIQSNV